MVRGDERERKRGRRPSTGRVNKSFDESFHNIIIRNREVIISFSLDAIDYQIHAIVCAVLCYY